MSPPRGGGQGVLYVGSECCWLCVFIAVRRRRSYSTPLWNRLLTTTVSPTRTAKRSNHRLSQAVCGPDERRTARRRWRQPAAVRRSCTTPASRSWDRRPRRAAPPHFHRHRRRPWPSVASSSGAPLPAGRRPEVTSSVPALLTKLKRRTTGRRLPGRRRCREPPRTRKNPTTGRRSTSRYRSRRRPTITRWWWRLASNLILSSQVLPTFQEVRQHCELLYCDTCAAAVLIEADIVFGRVWESIGVSVHWKSEPPSSHRSLYNNIHLHCVKKHPRCFSYNSRKHCRMFTIFGRNVTEKVGNQKMLYFPTSHNYCFCTTLQNWKHGKCVFSRKCFMLICR